MDISTAINELGSDDVAARAEAAEHLATCGELIRGAAVRWCAARAMSKRSASGPWRRWKNLARLTWPTWRRCEIYLQARTNQPLIGRRR